MKQNTLKSIVSALAIFMLLSTGIASAETSTKNTISGPTLTINLDNIEKIMLERSPSIKKIKNDTWVYEQQYDDLEDKVGDLQDEISRLGSQKDAVGKPVDNSAKISTLYGQISSLSTSRNQLSLASNLAESTLDQQINQQILKAKQLFVSCLANQEMLKVSDTKNLQTQRTLELAAEKLKRGYISQSAYNSIVNAASDSDVNQTSQVSSVSSEISDLKSLLGVDKGTTLILDTIEIPDIELDRILSLNFEEDLKYVMKASSTIKSAQIAYDTKSRSTDYNDYEESSAEASLQTAKDSVLVNFSRQYDSLINSYKSLKIAQDKLNIQQKTDDTQSALFKKGYISQTALENTQIATQTMKNQVATAKNLLFVSLEGYRQTRDGK